MNNKRSLFLKSNFCWFNKHLILSLGLSFINIQLSLGNNQLPASQWITTNPIDFYFPMEGEKMETKLAIFKYLQHYLKSPESLRVHSAIESFLQTQRIQANSPQSGLEALLAAHELRLIRHLEEWWIVPKQQVWKYQSYEKTILSPLPLTEILEELSQIGEIGLEFDDIQLQQKRIHQSLDFPTVEIAINELAKQFALGIEYRKGIHTLHFVDTNNLYTKTLQLKQVNQSQLQDFLGKTTESLEQLRFIKVVYPTERLIVISGVEKQVELLAKLITDFDATPPVQGATVPSRPYFKTFMLQIPQSYIQSQLEPLFTQYPSLRHQVTLSFETGTPKTTSVQQLASSTVVSLSGTPPAVDQVTEALQNIKTVYQEFQKSQPPVFDRLVLRYLHVGQKQIQSEGQTITLVGAESLLQQTLEYLSASFSNPPSRFQSKILPDLVNNAVMIWAQPEHIEIMKQMMELWDKPSPLIKIEAFIFETTETYSRELGLQFSGRGVPQGSTAPNVESSGAFTAGAVLGPFQTTENFRVDAVLRVLEGEGKGRVLSRPVVVTTNNLEAEMHSGSIINVKITNEA